MPCRLHFPSNILPPLLFLPEDLQTTEASLENETLYQIPQSRAQLDNCSHPSRQRFGSLLIAGPTHPEMKSQAQPTLDYRIISLSCARVRVRGARSRETSEPRHGYPASRLGPGGHLRFSATRWARGRAILPGPPQRALGGTRGRHWDRSPLGTAPGREGWSLERPPAAPGKAAPQEGRAGASPAAPARRSPPGGPARRGARPGSVSKAAVGPDPGPASGRSGTAPGTGARPLGEAPRPQAAPARRAPRTAPRPRASPHFPARRAGGGGRAPSPPPRRSPAEP